MVRKPYYDHKVLNARYSEGNSRYLVRLTVGLNSLVKPDKLSLQVSKNQDKYL